MQTIGIGIVGAGNIGSRHARFWAQVEGAGVVAVADTHPGASENLAVLYGDARAYQTVAELLANPNVTVVHVCVPTHLHREIAVAAANAGKHVLCEKPMALTLSDCDAIIAATAQAGVCFSVGHVTRFFPEYALAKARLDAGAVGTPTIARTRRAGAFPRTAWFADTAQSGGVVADLTVHDLDFLQWCFGKIIRVYAKIAASPGFEYALLTLRHESGVISHAEGVWGEPTGFHTAFEIAGTAGLFTHDSRAARALVASVRQPGDTPVALMNAPLAPSDDPYFRQVRAFADAVRGVAPVAVSPADARSAVAVALAAIESAYTGNAVEI
ncbi:MAG: Gfo/Idh/MocA family oxidoreductase [Armatimonadetes bacterium]|nr:Gfo/Idh/MocA family oxidoreductase [Armatimonadota bacterium]